MQPSLAVIIATFDRPQEVGQVLGDLARQPELDLEVVVVDQSEAEAHAKTAARIAQLGDPRVRHIEHHPPALPGARNRGLAETTAPIVVFLDDDVRLMPGLFEAHAAAYSDPGVGAVVGRIVERSARPNRRYTVNRVSRSGRVHTNLEGRQSTEVEALKGANMSVRRRAIRQVGGFDAHYGGTALLEDADLAERLRRAGWRVCFVPEAELLHLSAPQGGVRQRDRAATEWWRFHNTGYFVRRHRRAADWPGVALTFGAIALRRALQWHDAAAVPRLLGALHRGWRAGSRPPDYGSVSRPDGA